MKRCVRCGKNRTCKVWDDVAVCEEECIRLIVLEWFIKRQEVDLIKTS